MTTVDAGPRRRDHEGAADRALVELARGGDAGAFAELWARHRTAAYGAARCITASIDPDDLVSEAYVVILEAIRKGGGPTGDGFRPYLYATVRNLARRWGSRRREIAVDELPELEDAGDDLVLGGQIGSLDRRLVRDAFEALPARWREVLWYTEVEGMSPAEVAQILGLNANAAAVLAFRAREGLRQAWLQAHVADALDEGECAWVRTRIGEHSRDGLGKRAAARVDTHLAKCKACRDIALEVGQVNRQLARVLVPLLIGAGPAAAWLASPSAPAAAAAGGIAATGVAAGAVGATGSGASVVVGTAAAATALTVLAAFGGISIQDAAADDRAPAGVEAPAAPVTDGLPTLPGPAPALPADVFAPIDRVLEPIGEALGPGLTALESATDDAVDRLEDAIATGSDGQVLIDVERDPAIDAPNLSTDVNLGEGTVTIDLDLGGDALIDLDGGIRRFGGLDLRLDLFR